MALPAIQPYPMPGRSAMPDNRVSWSPDPGRAALLIHDMQQYFADAFVAGESPLTELTANIRRLKTNCVELGVPVIYTAQPGGQTPEQRALLLDFWGPGLDDGPGRKRIVEPLAPDESDIVITKWRYSAFRKTDLLDTLRELGRDQLIVCGIYAHIGCLMTACDAFMQDVQPFFVGDAVADFSRDYHEMALTYAAERCAVVLTAEETADALKRSPNAARHRRDGSISLRALREQVAGLLYETPSEIGDDDDLVDRGLDSVRIMSLAESWRRRGADITFAELAERPTLGEWSKLLSSRMAGETNECAT
ncbi:isochorismatase family protein [Paenibacillus sp. GYB003]|uniref:isochorismatase family protein n=1 Tax=Paenibacillus sp. GYB003 TaxID=2994392 RepID=UPI002F96B348